MTADDIILMLDGVTSVDDQAQLAALQAAVEAIPDCGAREATIPACLRVFERFPTSDGYGIFWSILHLVEEFPGYESELVNSVRRAPGGFNFRMVNRLINAGIHAIASTDLMTLLADVATNPAYSLDARQAASNCLEYQNGKTC